MRNNKNTGETFTSLLESQSNPDNPHMCFLESKILLIKLPAAYPVFVGANLFHLESFGTFAFGHLARYLKEDETLVYLRF